MLDYAIRYYNCAARRPPPSAAAAQQNMYGQKHVRTNTTCESR